MNKMEVEMKKAVSILLLICSMVCIILTGCSESGETYVVKQVLIDVNGDCILLDINDKTLSDYAGVAKGIDCIGNKIIINDDKVIFNGKDTKDVNATISENDVNINFTEVPTFIIKGAKFVNSEVHMYISVNQTLSYLIYKKK